MPKTLMPYPRLSYCFSLILHLITYSLQETADLATDFSDGFYPLQFNDGLATATNLATDLPTDKIPSPK